MKNNEGVIITRQTTGRPLPASPHAKSKTTNDCSDVPTLWLLLSGASLVTGLVALGVAVGLHISVSNQVGRLQISINEETTALYQGLATKQKQQDEVKNQTKSQNKDIQIFVSVLDAQRHVHDELVNETADQAQSLFQLKADVFDQQQNLSAIHVQANFVEETLNKTTSITDEELFLGYTTMKDGWVTPFNGYQYKITDAYQNWDDSWDLCHNMNATLANQGIRDIQIRRILLQFFQPSSYVWIGLNYASSTGRWYWINNYKDNTGDYATEESALWYYSEPDNYDCGVIRYAHGQSYDYDCYNQCRALCEKEL